MADPRADILSAALDAAGLRAHAFLSGEAMRGAMRAARPDDDASSALLERYGAARAPGCAAVALPYGEGDWPAPGWARTWAERRGPDPGAVVARFARANWYAEMDARLACAIATARTAFSRQHLDPGAHRDWRRLVNSPIPERPVALAAGLGWIGRNGILVAGSRERPCAAGSACVLGILLLPFDPGGEAKAAPRTGVRRQQRGVRLR